MGPSEIISQKERHMEGKRCQFQELSSRGSQEPKISICKNFTSAPCWVISHPCLCAQSPRW